MTEAGPKDPTSHWEIGLSLLKDAVLVWMMKAIQVASNSTFDALFPGWRESYGDLWTLKAITFAFDVVTVLIVYIQIIKDVAAAGTYAADRMMDMFLALRKKYRRMTQRRRSR